MTMTTTSIEEVQFSSIVSMTFFQDRLAKNFQIIVDNLKKDRLKSQSQAKFMRSQIEKMQQIIKNLPKPQVPIVPKQEKNTNFITLQILQRGLEKQSYYFNQKLQGLQRALRGAQSEKKQQLVYPQKNQKDYKILIQKNNQLSAKLNSNQERINEISEKLIKNFSEHQIISQYLQRKLKKQLNEIVPSLQKMLDKAASIQGLQNRVTRIASMMDSSLASIVDKQQQQLNQIRKKLVRLQQSSFASQQSLKYSKAYLNQRQEIFKKLRENQLLTLQVKSKLPQFTPLQKTNHVSQKLDDLEKLLFLANTPPDQAVEQPTDSSSTKVQVKPKTDEWLLQKIHSMGNKILSLASKQQLNRVSQSSSLKVRQLQQQVLGQIDERKRNQQAIWTFLKNIRVPQIPDYGQRIQQMQQAFSLKNTHLNKKHQDLLQEIAKLKATLAGFRDDFQNFQSLSVGSVSINKSMNDSTFVKMHQKPTGLEQLKKQYQSRLHNLKMQIVGFLKDFQRKYQNNKNYENQINNMLSKMEEVKFSVAKKADMLDTKKTLNYLQAKIINLFLLINKQEGSQEDARVAKKNWFCMSCDKLLNNYNGKIGKHVSWDSFPNRRLNSKKQELPSIKKD